jgi:hypothetical protein
MQEQFQTYFIRADLHYLDTNSNKEHRRRRNRLREENKKGKEEGE